MRLGLKQGLLVGLNNTHDSGDFMLKTHVIQTADGDNLTLSGLDGDADGYYTILARLILPSATAQIITLRPNGLTTNLFNQFSIQWDQTPSINTTPPWQLANFTALFTGTPNIQLDLNIQVYSSRTSNGATAIRGFRADAHLMGTAAGLQSYEFQSAGIWNDAASNLTSLTIHNSVASAVEAGSQALVYTPNVSFTP